MIQEKEIKFMENNNYNHGKSEIEIREELKNNLYMIRKKIILTKRLVEESKTLIDELHQTIYDGRRVRNK